MPLEFSASILVPRGEDAVANYFALPVVKKENLGSHFIIAAERQATASIQIRSVN